ncbi:MAG: ATP-binding protein [Bacteroidales bacterium]
MRFADIEGQAQTKARLIRSVQENRISHAQLFVGPEGNGKLALAVAYAQYINCSKRNNTDSCGECKSCKKYKKLVHPDLMFVYPVVKKGSNSVKSTDYINEWVDLFSKTPHFSLFSWLSHIGVGNSQGTIYSSESLEIIKRLSLKSYESPYKTIIIWLPEKMQVECANKILKILEEPPQNTVFLLVSEEESALLDTIRSRTQKIDIPKFNKTDISRILTKDYPHIGSNEIETIAQQCEGNVEASRQMLENNELTEGDSNSQNLEYFKDLMRTAWKKQWSELFTWADTLASQGREKQKDFLEYSIIFIRNNFILNLQEPSMVHVSTEEMSFATNFSKFINEKNIWDFYQMLEECHFDIQRNGNAKIIFLDMALKTAKFLRKN